MDFRQNQANRRPDQLSLRPEQQQLCAGARIGEMNFERKNFEDF